MLENQVEDIIYINIIINFVEIENNNLNINIEYLFYKNKYIYKIFLTLYNFEIFLDIL